MSQNQMDTLFDVTAREGSKFTEHFFREIDSRKTPSSITDGTTIVWNGNPLAGTQPFQEMLSQSPGMTHELTSLDVQPFPNGDTRAINMIIQTSGSTELRAEDKVSVFAFSAQFVVRRQHEHSPLVLQTLSYRLVHMPQKSQIPI